MLSSVTAVLPLLLAVKCPGNCAIYFPLAPPKYAKQFLILADLSVDIAK